MTGQGAEADIDDVIRDRAARLFDYLKAVRAIKESPVREFAAHNDRSWSMGTLPDVSELQVGPSHDGPWLSMKKPATPRLVELPAALGDYVLGAVSDADDPPALKPDLAELFEGELSTVRDVTDSFNRWMAEVWSPWAATAKDVYRARRLFDDFYEMRLRLAREEAETELVWGHGVMLWQSPAQTVCYPLITTDCTLAFDSETGSIAVVAEGTPKLEIDTLQHLAGAFDHLVDVRQTFRESPSDPWDIEDTRAVYKRVLNCLGQNWEIEDGPLLGTPSETPRVVLTSVLFVRRRATMFAKFFEEMREHLVGGGRVPAPIAMIVADEPSTIDAALDLDGDASEWSRTAGRLLMPLPANEEQQQIAARLGTYTGAVVQGPPGTGKTHTIANLVAHLVAHGKRVLVTAHKEQPLQVLRDKVPEDVRDLCVAVLGSSANTLGQLDTSLQAISEKASTLDKKRERRRVKSLEEQLDQLAEEIAALKARQVAVSRGESRKFELSGREMLAADLGKWLASEEKRLGFVPDAVRPETPCPLRPESFGRLLELEASIEPRDRIAAVESLPDPSSLPSAQVLAEKFAELARLRESLRQVESTVAEWTAIDAAEAQTVIQLEQELRRSVETCDELDEPWLREIAQSVLGEAGLTEWSQSIGEGRAQIAEIEQLRLRLNRYRIELPGENVPTKALVDQLTELRERFASGKGLWRFGNKDLKTVHAHCLLDGESTRSAQEIDLLLECATMKRKRVELVTWWNATASPVGAPQLADDSSFPERDLGTTLDLIDAVIRWETQAWPALRARVEALRVAAPPRPSRTAIQLLVDQIAVAENRFAERGLVGEIEALGDGLQAGANSPARSPLWSALLDALSPEALERWSEALVEAGRLRRLTSDVEELDTLSRRLAAAAPLLAGKIREARGAIGIGPPLFEEMWRWRQAETWLTSLLSEDDPVEIAALLEDRQAELRKKTEELCAASAWLSVASSLTDATRQSLTAWAQALRKVGKGKGKYAGKWRAEANKAMHDAVEAVPVWIMPMYRVAESFSPDQTPFDVVIVDESSQCDVFSLAALALARKAVVVGDDKQISPQAVGTNQAEVTRLINQHIPDIPYSQLFDPLSSLYDLAKRTFPGVIVLREHFRCLPEIIQFSNDLCYEGKIRPLREDIANPAWLPVLDRVVEGGFFDRGRKINLPEASAVVATVEDLIAESAYAGKTMGVISLLGSEQARVIEEKLISRIGEVEMERRQIRCGDAYHFQGDERDVMFISLVAAPFDATGEDVRPGAFVREPDMQRLNVAASRARDQLWLFRSLGPDDLPNNDLRARFIRYCADPHRSVRVYEELEDKCDSQFERDVLRRILARQYSVSAQHRVGHFKIDFVIHGMRGKLAVECDGDAWHGPEQWEDDRRRQEILERLGWKFFRVRGSAFYRDPERALAPLWARVEELGIAPGPLDVAADSGVGRHPHSLTIRSTAAVVAQDDHEGGDPHDGSAVPSLPLPIQPSPQPLSGGSSVGRDSPAVRDEPTTANRDDRPSAGETNAQADGKHALDAIERDLGKSLARAPTNGARRADETDARTAALPVEQSDPTTSSRPTPVASAAPPDTELAPARTPVERTNEQDQNVEGEREERRNPGAPPSGPETKKPSGHKLDPDRFREMQFREVAVGVIAMQISMVVAEQGRAEVKDLQALYEQRFSVKVDLTDERLFTKFVWSAVGHKWLRWDDPDEKTTLLPGSKRAEPLDPPGKWTIDEIWEIAVKAIERMPRADGEELFNDVLAQVHPGERRAPTLLRSLVGKAIYAAKNPRLTP